MWRTQLADGREGQGGIRCGFALGCGGCGVCGGLRRMECSQTPHILNKNGETFVAGHIHQAPVGIAGPIVVAVRRAFTADERAPHQAKPRGDS
jgi:hypothetical protein